MNPESNKSMTINEKKKTIEFLGIHEIVLLSTQIYCFCLIWGLTVQSTNFQSGRNIYLVELSRGQSVLLKDKHYILPVSIQSEAPQSQMAKSTN